MTKVNNPKGRDMETGERENGRIKSARQDWVVQKHGEGEYPIGKAGSESQDLLVQKQGNGSIISEPVSTEAGEHRISKAGPGRAEAEERGVAYQRGRAW